MIYDFRLTIFTGISQTTIPITQHNYGEQLCPIFHKLFNAIEINNQVLKILAKLHGIQILNGLQCSKAINYLKLATKELTCNKDNYILNNEVNWYEDYYSETLKALEVLYRDCKEYPLAIIQITLS